MTTFNRHPDSGPVHPVCAFLASRLYYGWVILAIATLAAICTSPSQTFGIAPFNSAIRQDLGLSHSQLAAAYMFGTLLASLPMSYIGMLSDRFGLRRSKIVVVVLLAAACGVTAMASGLLTLFLAFFLLRMLGQGALSMLSSNTLAFWFERRLGTVEGLRHLGMAGAIGIVPAMNLWLLDAVGWRWAYLILGSAMLVLMLPLLLWLFHDRPEHVGQCCDGAPVDDEADPADDPATPLAGFTLGEAVRMRTFWFAALPWVLWGMVNTAVLFHIVPLFEQRGLGEADVAALFTAFAVSLAIMHVIGGALADRVPLPWLIAASTACVALSMLWMNAVDSRAMVIGCGACMGVAQATLLAAMSPLWPRYFGRRHIGSIRGFLATLAVASTSVGPFILGAARDWTGEYDGALTAFAGIAVLVAVAAPLAIRRPTLPDPAATDSADPPR